MLFSYNGSELSAVFEDGSVRGALRLRGVWVTTVRNNDFPSPSVFEGGFDESKFKQEFQDILSRARKFNLNALFFQVRPEGDAFYPSKLNPWSKYLTGKQGVAPVGGKFDPLAYLIDATHRAGMEFHAWLNPYRLTPSNRKSANKDEALKLLAPGHYVYQYLDWAYFYNGMLYLDPGVPAVTDFIVATVAEIINHYAVDAIHFDDFFYPYPYWDSDKMILFADQAPDMNTYKKYRVDDSQTIDEWREANINEMIYGVHKEIQRHNRKNKLQVEFGISPFGIWASDQEIPGGSKTSPNQLSSMKEWVNTKLWIEAGWIDYVVPQVYWSFAEELSPFDVVAKWWNDVVSGTGVKLYLGLGLYLYEEDAKWPNSDEIVKQLEFARGQANVSGVVFFTYHNFVDLLATSAAMKSALPLLEKELNQ